MVGLIRESISVGGEVAVEPAITGVGVDPVSMVGEAGVHPTRIRERSIRTLKDNRILWQYESLLPDSKRRFNFFMG